MSLEQVDKNVNEGVVCTGDRNHFWCVDCMIRDLNQNVRTRFEGTVRQGRIESLPGMLPCSQFPWYCACRELSMGDVLRVLALRGRTSTIVDALARVAIRKNEEAERARKATLAALTPQQIELIKAERVIEYGIRCECSQCGTRIVKDTACIHMNCSARDNELNQCRFSFCYVCLQDRDVDDRCRCDTRPDAFLENHEEFANIQGMTPAMALAEFHIRRTAYFLHIYIERIGRPAWDSIVSTKPTILDNIMADKSLTQEQIDRATSYPLVADGDQVAQQGVQIQMEGMFAYVDNWREG